jgi:plasmid stabilization system protein ParE
MSRRSLIVEPEAEADLLDAYLWYEKQRVGLGEEFFAYAEAAFDRITATPEQFAKTYKDVRQALVKRFPYVVCFLVEKDEIVVIAVFHGHRDSTGWRSRIK